jgi:hypothetical protein
MHNVQKPSDSEHCTPLSELFRFNFLKQPVALILQTLWFCPSLPVFLSRLQFASGSTACSGHEFVIWCWTTTLAVVRPLMQQARLDLLVFVGHEVWCSKLCLAYIPVIWLAALFFFVGSLTFSRSLWFVFLFSSSPILLFECHFWILLFNTIIHSVSSLS